jgi:hypothetical protein
MARRSEDEARLPSAEDHRSRRLHEHILGVSHRIAGSRDLNVGTWITRRQPQEYTIRTTGWVRLVSGLRSLISVYRVPLWVLTYFGRPFD